MTLTHHLESAVKFAKETFEKKGSVCPMFIAYNGEKTLTVIATPWNDEREKLASLEMVKRIFRLERVTSYVFMSEVWYKSVSPEGLNAHLNSNKAVSEYDDKEEALMVMGTNTEGEKLGRFFKIKRSAEKTELLAIENPNGFEGRLFELLSKPSIVNFDEQMVALMKDMWNGARKIEIH